MQVVPGQATHFTDSQTADRSTLDGRCAWALFCGERSLIVAPVRCDCTFVMPICSIQTINEAVIVTEPSLLDKLEAKYQWHED